MCEVAGWEWMVVGMVSRVWVVVGMIRGMALARAGMVVVGVVGGGVAHGNLLFNFFFCHANYT